MRLNLFITMDCNMDCSYCYVKNKGNRYMSFEMAKKAIDFAYSKKEQGQTFNIMFQGGEPLLNWNLVKEIYTYCTEKYGEGCFGITTNGILLDDEKVDFLEKKLFTFRLSVDGAMESHDKNRKFKDGTGTFKNLKNALNMFKRFNAPGKKIRFTITKNNVKDFNEGVSFLLDQGISEIDLGLNYFDEWDKDSLETLVSNINKLADLFIKKINEGNKEFSIAFFENIINHSKNRGKSCDLENIISRKNDCFCGLGKKAFSINPEGDIFPCSFFVSDDKYKCESIGNVNTGEISTYKFDYDYTNQTSCHGCDLQYRCASNCIVINKLLTGDYYTPAYQSCELQKALIMCADRVYKYYKQI